MEVHHHITLRLGTLNCLTVGMGETTQSKAMEGSDTYQHRHLKNSPSAVFFQKKTAFFPPGTDRSKEAQLFAALGNMRRDFNKSSVLSLLPLTAADIQAA